MITIGFSTNDDWFEGVYLMLLSIVRRTKEPCKFVCLSGNFLDLKSTNKILSQSHAEIIRKMVKHFNPSNEFELVDCTKMFYKHYRELRWKERWSGPYTMLRTLIHEINCFQGRILFLDSDLMFNRDVKEFFDSSILNIDAELLCTKDFWVRFKYLKRYFNTGVMLVDMDKIRKNKSFEHAIDYIMKKRPTILEQDAFNKCCKVKAFCKDDQRFNYQKNGIKNDTVVKHFISARRIDRKKSKIRQWQIDKVHSILHLHNWDEDYEFFINEKKKWTNL